MTENFRSTCRGTPPWAPQGRGDDGLSIEVSYGRSRAATECRPYNVPVGGNDRRSNDTEGFRELQRLRRKARLAETLNLLNLFG